MKKSTILIAAALVAVGSAAHARGNAFGGSGTGSNSSGHSVSGYVTRNGTYVAPHRQSDSNGTRYDNWSTRGNVNPDTGRIGSRDPEAR